MSWGGVLKRTVGFNSTFRSVCSDRLLEKILTYKKVLPRLHSKGLVNPHSQIKTGTKKTFQSYMKQELSLTYPAEVVHIFKPNHLFIDAVQHN